MDRLAAADAWFLYLEGPTVPLHVTGLLVLDPSTAPNGFSFATLRRYLAARLDELPALRRRLVEVPLAIDHPCWIEDPDFDLDQHMHRHVLRGDRSAEGLAHFVGEFASTRLRRDRPLWDMVLVEGLDDGAVAVVIKMHHCIVDGITGMNIVAHLLDVSAAGTRGHRSSTWESEPVPTVVGAVASAVVHRLATPLRPLRAASGAVSSLAHISGAAVRRRLGGAEAIAHPINAPRTPFNASITANRAVAFGRVPLVDFKTIGRAFGVTVNDVVLAVCTHGLRRYLETWSDIPDRPLVCSVPVSTHHEGEGASANQVSNMFVHLPVHLDDPVAQLRAIHEGSLGAKEVQRAVGTDLISNVVELIPSSLFHVATRLYSEAGIADRLAPVHNLIVSNVIGSPVPLYMAGAQVVAMYPFGPLMEGTGLNITVLSNYGEMNIGLIVCPDLVRDFDGLLGGILDGVTTLLEAAEQAVDQRS